jgi:hypothetical protein
MARYQVKPREDGRGPYRWSHVVKRHAQLRQGTIYTQMGDELDAKDSTKLRGLCDNAGFEMRRVA